MTTAANDNAYPIVINEDTTDSFDGLTKREYFAAKAEVPKEIIELFLKGWRGDHNELPEYYSESFESMIDQLAAFSARYKCIQAGKLIDQLNEK